MTAQVAKTTTREHQYARASNDQLLPRVLITSSALTTIYTCVCFFFERAVKFYREQDLTFHFKYLAA